MRLHYVTFYMITWMTMLKMTSIRCNLDFWPSIWKLSNWVVEWAIRLISSSMNVNFHSWLFVNNGWNPSTNPLYDYMNDYVREYIHWQHSRILNISSRALELVIEIAMCQCVTHNACISFIIHEMTIFMIKRMNILKTTSIDYNTNIQTCVWEL